MFMCSRQRGDAGGALGAAFALWHMKGGKRYFLWIMLTRDFFTNDDFKKLITKHKERLDDEDLKTTFFKNKSLYLIKLQNLYPKEW